MKNPKLAESGKLKAENMWLFKLLALDFQLTKLEVWL